MSINVFLNLLDLTRMFKLDEVVTCMIPDENTTFEISQMSRVVPVCFFLNGYKTKAILCGLATKRDKQRQRERMASCHSSQCLLAKLLAI